MSNDERDWAAATAERVLPCDDVRYQRKHGEFECVGQHDARCPACFRTEVAHALREAAERPAKRDSAWRTLLERALRQVGLDPDGLTDIGCVDWLVKTIEELREAAGQPRVENAEVAAEIAQLVFTNPMPHIAGEIHRVLDVHYRADESRAVLSHLHEPVEQAPEAATTADSEV